MAATYTTEAVIVAFKLLSKDKSKTWDGNSFENHSAVSTYATDGNLTFTDDPSPAGGNETEYTVTLPTLPITGGADTFYLVPFTATPAYTGGYIVGAVPQDNWKVLTVNDDQELVDDESLEEGGGGGSATVVPIGAVLTQFSVPKVDLELDQGGSRTFQVTFTGSTGNPTSFQGDTITCVVSTIRGTTAQAEVSCTVLTTDYNVVSIPFTGSHTATAGMFRHELWNETDDQKIAYGAVPIARAVGYST